MRPASPSASHPLRLYKKEKLCSVIAIGQLFKPAAGGDAGSGPSASLSYPVRMVWRVSPGRRSDAPVQFLVSVPKKRLRHAVDRVLMRRRIREAYRLQRSGLSVPDGILVDIAFMYVGKGIEPYALVENAMKRLLGRLGRDLAALGDDGCCAFQGDEPRPTAQPKADDSREYVE